MLSFHFSILVVSIKTIEILPLIYPLYAGKIVLLANQTDDTHTIPCNVAITAKFITLKIRNDKLKIMTNPASKGPASKWYFPQ